ncbi:hypothetical protein L207DRAFT_582801 [Hyaloscypha variabilis F]|uniref:Mid2 domain-containing protein n=1 Tax=Hyaloscypha variabilis (strain UAMH 11265 / GT02V1 / F) TaxID=1149755 RepID=A0A2J6RQ21_HYAVF|nr:hypothetical protein L207DRAFT_582801 [Hyaloscypha variabilis F]
MYQAVITITALLALSARHIEGQEIFATECYFKDEVQGIHLVETANPCGVVTPTTNFTSCCVAEDTCLEIGICHYTHPMPGPPTVETGYYMGGCTDVHYAAPACPLPCTDQDLPDVVYNTTTQIWHCCGVINGSVRCDTPSDETFSAPAPSQLSATFTVASTPITSAASTSSTTTGTTAITPPSSPTQTPGANGNGGGLSGGAKAGIGVGCAVAALASVGVLIWFFTRRRNMNAADKQSQETPFMAYPQSTEVPFTGYPQKFEPPVELAERGPEQKTETVRAELG